MRILGEMRANIQLKQNMLGLVIDKFRSLHKPPRSLLQVVRIGYLPEVIAIDFVRGTCTLPSTPNANAYVLVLLDLFSRFVYAARVSNPCIPFRHEGVTPANDVTHADSPNRSSAHNCDSEDSAHSLHSNLDSLPKTFLNITSRPLGKRKLKRNDNIYSVYRLVLPSLYTYSSMDGMLKERDAGEEEVEEQEEDPGALEEQQGPPDAGANEAGILASVQR